MTLHLQELIHRFEEGAGAKYILRGTALLVLLALALVYNDRQFQNFSAPEAMDTAQLARNLAEGKGYTTQFIRPVSLYLLQKHQSNATLSLNTPHPDLANAPAYPYLLAAWMTVAPFKFQITAPADFQQHQPELLIAWLNQGLFVLALWLVFRLARKLFDEPVAWLSLLVVGGSDLFWRFTISGLSTVLLMVLFLVLVHALVALERGSRLHQWGAVKMICLAAFIGAAVGLGALTRYSFAWLILPVLAFLCFALERRRGAVALVALAAYLGVLTPWLQRNYQLCGHLFGTAGLVLYQDTGTFTGNRLERALNPENPAIKSDWGKIDMDQYEQKLLGNTAKILQHELPQLGGSWVSAFFLVGLMIQFKDLGLNRVRLFLLLCLALLTSVQALGKTHLSETVPELNSENLLVLVAPLVFIYGVGLFSMLLEALASPLAPARRGITAAFSVVACAPLLFSLWLPRPGPVAYPPYYPPIIQEASSWLTQEEWMMSDMPWAVAWYGRRPCLWLTWDLADFQTLHRQRPIQALYLTPLTMDTRFLSQMMQSRDSVWGKFALDSALKEEIPDGFPLKHAFASWFPDQLFLADRPRWTPAKK